MIGGLLITLTVFPLIKLLPISHERKQHTILLLIHLSFKFFMKYMQWLSPIESFEIEGLDHIHKHQPCIFIANHPTLIDIVAIMSCIPFCSCLIKQSLAHHVYIGRVVRAAGYIVNDNATQLLRACHASFHTGRSLIIFPEGTRSPAYGLHPFNRGAAQIALRTERPVVPIVITYNYPTLLKGQPWFRIPEAPLRLKLQFFPPLRLPQDRQQAKTFPQQVRALNQSFEAFFREKLPFDSAVGHT
jgi:1-acyl-sn-glycerol-3-phosphate acyltransferase